MNSRQRNSVIKRLEKLFPGYDYTPSRLFDVFTADQKQAKERAEERASYAAEARMLLDRLIKDIEPSDRYSDELARVKQIIGMLE